MATTTSFTYPLSHDAMQAALARGRMERSCTILGWISALRGRFAARADAAAGSTGGAAPSLG